MYNNLQFKNSQIYPDNAHINWVIDGKGIVGNKCLFRIITNETSLGYSNFIEVVNEKNDVLECSKIFWDIEEWSNLNKEKKRKNDFHLGRRAAMQWAEDWFLNFVKNNIKNYE